MELELPGAGFFGAAPVPEPIFWSKAAPAASFWKAKKESLVNVIQKRLALIIHD